MFFIRFFLLLLSANRFSQLLFSIFLLNKNIKEKKCLNDGATVNTGRYSLISWLAFLFSLCLEMCLCFLNIYHTIKSICFDIYTHSITILNRASNGARYEFNFISSIHPSFHNIIIIISKTKLHDVYLFKIQFSRLLFFRSFL